MFSATKPAVAGNSLTAILWNEMVSFILTLEDRTSLGQSIRIPLHSPELPVCGVRVTGLSVRTN